MGTPNYLSPEQARGDRDLDGRVDLYACGVVLYEAVTGRRPFCAANQADLLREILNARPRPARDLRRALPIGLEAVLAKAMAFDREDRYQTAQEFQRDLRRLGDPVPCAPVSARAFEPPSYVRPDADDQPTQVWRGSPASLAHPRAASAVSGSSANERNVWLGNLPPLPAAAPAMSCSPANERDDIDTLIVKRLPESLLRAARRPAEDDLSTASS